jgi:hypothetical protein
MEKVREQICPTDSVALIAPEGQSDSVELLGIEALVLSHISQLELHLRVNAGRIRENVTRIRAQQGDKITSARDPDGLAQL